MAWKVELTVQEAHIIGCALKSMGEISFVAMTKSENTKENMEKVEQINRAKDSLLDKLRREFCFEPDITELVDKSNTPIEFYETD